MAEQRISDAELCLYKTGAHGELAAILARDLLAARELLGEVQWSEDGMDGNPSRCPTCGTAKRASKIIDGRLVPTQHAPDCRLAALIGR